MIALGDTLDGTARANAWPIRALSPTYIIRPVLILATMIAALGLGACGIGSVRLHRGGILHRHLVRLAVARLGVAP